MREMCTGSQMVTVLEPSDPTPTCCPECGRPMVPSVRKVTPSEAKLMRVAPDVRLVRYARHPVWVRPITQPG